MGRAVCTAVTLDPDLELVAAVAPRSVGESRHGVTITGERLAEEVYPSVVFFQDTYHLNIDRIFVAGLPDLAGAAPALRAQTGADVQELVGGSPSGGSRGSIPKWQIAGVAGALAS